MNHSTLIPLLISASTSLFLGLVLTRWLASRNEWARGLDHPRSQSLHQEPVSRLGGVAILVAILAGMFSFSVITREFRVSVPLVMGLTAIASISLLDDLVEVLAWKRLVIQSVGAILILFDLSIGHCPGIAGWSFCLPEWLNIFLLFMGIVWMINLTNFMDGADGLVAGVVSIAFAILGCLGLLAGHITFAVSAFVVAASVAGFLAWNLPPAAIFMGDSGSTSLGFLAAAFTLWGNHEGIFPLEAGLLVFGPLVVDATVTLGRRLYLRERIWEPHRKHYYQRFILAGHPVRYVLASYYALTLVGGLSVVAFEWAQPDAEWLLLAFWAVLYLAALGLVEGRLRRKPVIQAVNR